MPMTENLTKVFLVRKSKYNRTCFRCSVVEFPLQSGIKAPFILAIFVAFCDCSGIKWGVEPNWRIYRTAIARAQKPVKNRKYKRGLTVR